MPTDVTSLQLEVLSTPEAGTKVSSLVLEVLAAPDVDSTQVHSLVLEVLSSSRPAGGPGGVGGVCPVVPAGTRLWWALDVEIAGLDYHFGTVAGTLDGVVYRSGLGALELSRLADLAGAVSLQITSADDWPSVLRTARWLADGGKARLYLVVEEDGATRRLLWMDGRADSLRWGLFGEPLQLQLVPSVEIGQLPPEQWVVDETTRPAQIADDPQLPALIEASAYEIYEDSIGELYPLVIGYPGHVEGADPYPCVPAPVVQWASFLVDTRSVDADPMDPADVPEEFPENFVHCIAGGAVEATSVYALDKGIYTRAGVITLGGGPDAQTEVYQRTATPSGTLKVGPDLLGQYTTWLHQNYSHRAQGGEPEMWTGWSPEGGGGVQHNGRLVRGASDLFAWLVETATSLRLDRGRHAAHAAYLNSYRIDTWVNEPVQAFEWFSANVLELLPAAIVRGPDGLYLAHLPLRASRVDSVLTLTDGVDGEYAGLATSGSAGVVNHLTYSWGPNREGGWVFNYTLTREYRLAQRMSSGAYYGDPRMLPHALAKLSHNEYGARPGRLELGVVWDAGTAHRMAEDYVIRQSFPERQITMALRPEFYWVEPGMVATVSVPRLGVETRLMTVVDVVMRVTGPEVVLRPIRSLTDYL